MIIICSEEEKRTFVYQTVHENFCPFLYCVKGRGCINDCEKCIYQNVRFVTEMREENHNDKVN